MSKTYGHAVDRLGPHLLGRKPSDPLRLQLAPRFEQLLQLETQYTAAETLQDLADDPHFDPLSLPLLYRFVQQLRRHPKPPPPPPPGPPGAVWPDSEAVLDQGQTPHCVGGGGCQWGNTLPVDDRFANADLHRLYYACKVIDGEPSAEDGTSVHTLATALQQWGRLAAFGFAQNLSEIDSWLSLKGAVIVGTDWTQDMFGPDANGTIHVTGSVAGGHCYLFNGKAIVAGVACYEILNDWGGSWGLNGRAYIPVSEFDGLLQAQGEACLALELPL